MKRLLITICGRAGSKGFKNKNLKNFCGKPLVYYSLSAAELFIKKHPELEIDVALNTDSEDLARLVAAEYPEVIYLPRGAELGGDRVPKVEVYKDSFARMETLASKQYDAMIDLDITSPLRTEQDIENAFANDICDFVFIGKSCVVEPHFVRLLQEGRDRELHPCIGCYVCASDQLATGAHCYCSGNGAMACDWRTGAPLFTTDIPVEIARGEEVPHRRFVQLDEAVVGIPQQRVNARRAAMAQPCADQPEAHSSEYAPRKLKVSGARSKSPSRPSTGAAQTSASISK